MTPQKGEATHPLSQELAEPGPSSGLLRSSGLPSFLGATDPLMCVWRLLPAPITLSDHSPEPLHVPT